MQKMNGKARKSFATGAAALGLALGSVGVGWAMGPSPTDTAPQTKTEAVDSGADVQDPQLAGSVSAPAEQGYASETAESTALADLATITEDEARNTALGAVPGTIGSVELGDENGSVVYEVSMTDDSGSGMELKVDAGDGAVLVQNSASDEVSEGGEATAPEESEAKAAEDDTDGVDHQFEGEETGNNGDGVADAGDANEVPEATPGA